MRHCTYIGLDVHKDSIHVAIADTSPTYEVRNYGNISGDLGSLDRVVRRLRSKNTELKFVYEAGPCGYGIWRHLHQQGLDCIVVAPSKTPKRPGERVKNDRRDAITLARLHRAGELQAIYVPLPEDEAMRDLSRAREDAKITERKAKQRLSAFLLRHGRSYSGGNKWTLAHRRWLSDQSFPHPAQQIAFQEYIDSLEQCEARVKRLTEQIEAMSSEWRLSPVVEAFQAMRGVSLINAVTLAAELGDIRRFDNPRELMGYLGLVPSEHSSGLSTRRGGITKSGNGHARRALIQGAWTYRHPAKVGRRLRDRRARLPEAVSQIGWNAQLRLCQQYRRLCARGKPSQVVVTAIAREMAGFLWDIARQVPIAA
jgi:transposase